MQLQNLIETHLDVARLSKDLDEIGHEGRIWAVRQWTPANMAVLYEAVKGFRPVTLDDYVPQGVAPMVGVHHHGKNSLPAHNFFQKRFSRVARAEGSEGPDILVGYNFQTLSPLTGPGYYVAHPSPDPGEVDIDYTMLPSVKPDEWPPIVPNSGRLGRFVYYGMIDVMRGISTHVSIGRAKKKHGWMDAWFVLVREDPRPPAPPSGEQAS
jgi:hypothetical protein